MFLRDCILHEVSNSAAYVDLPSAKRVASIASPEGTQHLNLTRVVAV